MTAAKKSDRNAFWQQHLSTWRKSKLSMAAYCRREHLKYSAFTHWQRKLDYKKVEKGSFVSLPVTDRTPPPPANPSATIELSGNVRIALPPMSPKELGEVVAALKEATS